MSRTLHALAASLVLSCIPAAALAQAGCTPEHAAMGHCTPAAATAAPREAIPVPTDADRAAAFAPLHAGHAHGTGIHSKIQFNRLEAWDADQGTGQA